jgi:hypothetical protein
MHLLTFHLIGPTHARLDPDTLTRQIDSHSRPVDRVEHLRVRCAPSTADIAVFVIAEDRFAAERTARAVCRRTLEHTPWLADWRLWGP